MKEIAWGVGWVGVAEKGGRVWSGGVVWCGLGKVWHNAAG